MLGLTIQGVYLGVQDFVPRGKSGQTIIIIIMIIIIIIIIIMMQAYGDPAR